MLCFDSGRTTRTDKPKHGSADGGHWFTSYFLPGRSTLQKRVMALLRRIEHPTPGNIEVRFDTFAFKNCRNLLNDFCLFNYTCFSTWGNGFKVIDLTAFIFVYNQAWEDTFGKWDQSTKHILNFPKNKADDGQVKIYLFPSLCRISACLFGYRILWNSYQTWGENLFQICSEWDAYECKVSFRYFCEEIQCGSYGIRKPKIIKGILGEVKYFPTCP